MQWGVPDLLILVVVFFTIAMLYSSVGFGGGSSYIAVLVLFAFPYFTIVQTALLCNIVVVSSSTYLFFKNRVIDFRKALPYVMASVPMAFLGGAIEIDKKSYLTLLGAVLLYSGLKVLISKSGNGQEKNDPANVVYTAESGNYKVSVQNNGRLYRKEIFSHTGPRTEEKGFAGLHKCSFPAAFVTGGAVGFISGMVGIGGGIILAPILHLTGRLEAKSIAAISAFFILVNSISGFAGQLTKVGLAVDTALILPLVAAVFLGGRLGVSLSLKKFSGIFVKRATGALVLFVSLRIFYQLYLS